MTQRKNRSLLPNLWQALLPHPSMKAINGFFLTTFAALLFAATCRASLDLPIPVPLDDIPSKFALWTNTATAKEIETDRKPYWKLEDQLRTLPESKLKSLFGASRVALPPGYALPVHHHAGVAFSGLGYRGQERSYFLPVAELGGVLVFPLGDKDFISAVTIYLKTDSTFVPLRNSSDYPARRAWELQRTEAIRKHIQKVLSPKAKDPFEGNSCFSRLRMIHGAKYQWMEEHHKTTNDMVTWDDVRPYFSHDGKAIPSCPGGGTYILGKMNESPTCSIPKHGDDYSPR